MRFSILLCFLMIACNLQNTANSAQESIEIDDPTGVIGPDLFPENVNPLTGLIVEDIAVLDRRPIIVKISNAPAIVRPQSGISQADIVFEHYVEGGLTRFSAVFYGQAPERVGSIRSARLIDHEIVPMFDGILAFSGASIGVEKYIYGSEYVNSFYDDIEGIADVFPGAPQPPSEYADRAFKGVLYGRPYYWRDESIPVPHNMFTSTTALWELATQEGVNQRPRLVGLAFHPDEAGTPATSAANQIDIRYRGTRVIWEYQAENGRYWRSADGLAHFDANNQEQISAVNVIVLYAEHTESLVIEGGWDSTPIYGYQIAVWGENSAVLFRDGQRYDGYWTRTLREDIFTFHTNDGELLYLKPGNTWIQVMPIPEQQNAEAEWLIVE